MTLRLVPTPHDAPTTSAVVLPMTGGRRLFALAERERPGLDGLAEKIIRPACPDDDGPAAA